VFDATKTIMVCLSQLPLASEPVAVLYLQLAQLRITGRTVMQQWTNSQFPFPHFY